MTARRVSILFAIGIAVVALAVWVSTRNQGGEGSIAGTRVLPGLEGSLNAVTEVRITKADKSQTTLNRAASDWIVGERDYPADSGKLRKLLLDLASLKVVQRKTRIASNYPVLGVQSVKSPGATGARVDIVSPGRTWSLIVGHSADSHNVFVRVVHSAQSLLATPLILVNADPKLWLDPTILDVPQDRVSEIDEHPAQGAAFSVSRANKAQADFTVHGIPRGRKLTGADAADSMGSALSNLTLTDVRKSTAPPRGTAISHAIFKTFDGLEIDISGYEEAKDHYIDVSAVATRKSADAEAGRINSRVRGWDYRIPGYRYEEVFQPLSALLQPLPTKKKAARPAEQSHAR
jgi:hypothetical protein